MRKFYNKIPLLIRNKISSSTSNHIEVASIRKLYKTQISSRSFEKIGVSLTADNQLSLKTILPNSNLGRHSKKNVIGYEEVLKSEPKILKTFDLGDRPIFGDWSRGSFPLYASKMVYKRIFHEPLNLSITPSLIETGSDQNGVYFILKISIDKIFSKREEAFEKHILFGINILMESNGDADVFDSTATKLDYIGSLSVDWEIFPPGTRELDISRILGRSVKLNQQDKRDFEERYDFLKSLNPIRFVKGLGGSSSYFGAIIREDLVVFENIKYGNAIYVLYEDWQDASKLSRSDIISGSYNYLRIIHSSNWKIKLIAAIKFDKAA